MFLLGLHGPAQSGKDTAFAVIEEVAAEADYKAVRKAFADKLKLSLYRLFDPKGTLEQALAWADDFKFNGHILALTTREELHPEVEGSPSEVWREPDFEITGRELLQRYGTEAHRDVFDGNFWLNALLPEPKFGVDAPWEQVQQTHVSNRFPDVDIVVITDVRFENEAERIRQLGGQVWRINRVDITSSDTHVSEAVLPDKLIDRVVENGHGVETYKQTVTNLVRGCIIPELRKD